MKVYPASAVLISFEALPGMNATVPELTPAQLSEIGTLVKTDLLATQYVQGSLSSIVIESTHSSSDRS